jgi:hypothetical protein
MPLTINTNRITGFYATQNYGKTYAIKSLITLVLESGLPVFVFDTNYESYAYSSGLPENLKSRLFFIKATTKSDQTNPKWINQMLIKLRSKFKNFFIVFEDIDKLYNSSNGDELDIIRQLASDSRHQRIGIIYATKEPTNIPVKLRSVTNLFFIGQFIEPAHLKTLGGFIDSKKIRALKKPEFIMLDRLTNITELAVFSENGFVDLKVIP